MATNPEAQAAELRTVIAFTQWESFRARQWAYLDYAKAQIEFWRERFVYHAGQLAGLKKKR